MSEETEDLKKALAATGMTQASAELIREFMALKDFPGINLDNRDPRIIHDLISAAICSLAAVQPDLALLNGPERCQDPAYLAWKAQVSEACNKVQEALTALVPLGSRFY